MRSRCGRRAFRASPIRCVGERIMATGVPEFREVAWRACKACNCRKNFSKNFRFNHLINGYHPCLKTYHSLNIFTNTAMKVWNVPC
ncbi:hypothetical protein [Bathymodiolus japonicus methanotrophic gill symbiont]|uniref:hypothetical protein n=1 Tax=Bathymodiolus japonicus methanotrophic gill symbiont TaxID=113269 RepID=UPI001C8E4F73|nr:hypothetical protein [Bathymodiolus japonicus methanotrophic gill symbiont]